MKTDKKWYQSTAGVIVLLILFFPVGLYLMWKHTNWNKGAKAVVTGVFALMILLGAVTSSTGSQFKTNDALQQPQVTEKPAATDTPTPAAKSGAITYDSLEVYLLEFNPTYNNDRYIGYTKDRKNNVTLVGTKDDIRQITFRFNGLNTSSYTPTYVIQLISTITHHAIPDWTDADVWFRNSYQNFSNSSDDAPSNQITVEDKTVELIFDKSANNLIFKITVNG